MKKIISVFLALALFISCFAGTITISAEDTAVTVDSEMKLGIGITLENDYKSEIIEAKNLGSNIIRISEPDDHDYTRLLKAIAFAEQHGMEIILNCDHINYEFLYDKEASEAAGERLPYTEAANVDVEAIKEHYTTLVNAVKGRVDYWKFGNELDNWYYKAGEQGRVYSEEYYLDVASAAIALGAASEAVKAIDAEAKTMINFGWLHYGFLDGLAENGFEWDVSGLDWYSSGSYDEVNGPNGTQNQFDYGDVINYLAENFVDKEIIICETGLAPSGLDENGDVIYIGDAEWLGGAINDIKTNYADKVSTIAVFKLNDTAPSTDEDGNVVYNKEDYYGIIDADGNKKDTYYAVQEAFGGKADWNILSGGNVDKVYDTLYKAASADTFGGPGIRVSDYAVTVGDRMMYRTSGDGWQYTNGVKNGAFTYDGTTFDRVYTVSPNTKNATTPGIKYTVAANTELHIPVVVPTAALAIMDYFKFEISSDGGETWSSVTPDIIETKSVKLYYESTMQVYSVRFYEACDFRIFFPPIWYDQEIVANDHTPNGTADGINDSPYDLLYDVNSGAVTTANGIMFMLPATAYTTNNAISLGKKDVITTDDLTSTAVWTDSTWGNTYIMDNATQYAKIVGRLAATPHSNNWRWTHYGSKNPYNADSTVYSFVPYYNGEDSVPTKNPYIEYFIEKGTVATFDIGLDVDYDKLTYDIPVRDQFVVELSTDNGATFNPIDSTNSYYTLNDKGNVRSYNVTITEDSVLRINFPDVSVMSADVVNSGANSAVSYLYAGAAFVTPVCCTEGVLVAGKSDEINPDDRVTSMVGETAKTYLGSEYSNVSDFATTDDICGTLVNYGSSWEWFNPDNFTLEPENSTYVYTATGNSKNAECTDVPYVDFNVAGDTAINLTVGTLTEMGDFTFKFAPVGSNTFTEVSADSYNVISETGATKVSYAVSGQAGKATLKLSKYSIALPQAGVLRVYYPASYKDMYGVVTSNYNTAVAFLCRSCTAFIVPPTAESINYGDANGDGNIDARDLVRAKKFIAQVEGLTLDKLAANVDEYSGVDSGDLIVMRNYLMGEIKNFK